MSAPEPAGDNASAGRIRASYAQRGAQVPASVEARIEAAAKAGRMDALEAVENFKRALVAQTGLDPKTAQLVNFAQMLVLGHAATARAHARFALRDGASLQELFGVVEHGAITAGMPAYVLGMEILCELAKDEQ